MSTATYKSMSQVMKRTYVMRIRSPALRARERFSRFCRRVSTLKRAMVEEYYKALLFSDGLVDSYLPVKYGKESVKLPALLIKKKGLAGIVTKIGKRSKLHATETAKKASRAVRNASTTIKMTVSAAVSKARRLPPTLRLKMASLLSSACTKGSALMMAADKAALRCATTARLRHWVVELYQDKISILVRRYLPVSEEAADDIAQGSKDTAAVLKSPSPVTPGPSQRKGLAGAQTCDRKLDLRHKAMANVSNKAVAPVTPGEAERAAGQTYDSPVTPDTPLYYLNM